MKKLLITLVIVFVSNIVLAQTLNTNNVQSTSYLEPVQDETEIANLSEDQKIETITYYDGLGRPEQSIAKQAGGNRQDIVTPIVYDAMGRQAKDYLPYADVTQTTGANLNYRTPSSLLTSIDSYYLGKHPDDLSGTPNPYSEKAFEASPLNRILEQGAPGVDWLVNENSDADHTIKFGYQSNTFSSTTSQTPSDNVIHYQVMFPTGNTETPQLFYNGYYNANELYKTITKDENWKVSSNKNHTTETFKNKQGQVVLKRTYNNDITHDTYYVYDDYGNLTYVLSPEGSNSILLANTYIDFVQAIKVLEFVPVDTKGTPVTTGTGELTVTLDDTNGTLTLLFNLQLNAAINLVEGPIALLKEHVPDMIIGTVANGNYTISIHDGFLYVSGSGLVNAVSETLVVNLPTHTVDDTILDDLCYQYHYDNRNRLVEKKIPSKDWEYIVYDKLDRPVLTQDALLRDNYNWLFTKYDAFGRVTYTGKLLSTNTTRQSLQSTLDTQSVLHDSRSTVNTIAGTTLYYDNLSYPTSDVVEVLTINYYDDYGVNLPATLNYQNSYNQTQSTNDKGLSTVSKVRVLDTNKWITTVTYYDDRARPIYTVSENGYLDALDKIKSQLDFVGKVLETETSHIKSANDAIITTDAFTYDHAGRLISQKQQINSLVPELIAKNYYDELGQLYQKEVGGETVFDGYIDVENVTYNTNTGIIEKISGGTNWNAGLATKGKFHGDGYVEATAEQANKNIMIGLSEINTNVHWNTMDFAIFITWNGNVKVYENGVNLGTFSTYVTGDIFRVERIGSTISYKKNAQVIYTSTLSSTGSLLGDLSINHDGAQVSNFRIESANLNTTLQTVDYTYNIRGWLKTINDVDDLATDEDLFAFKLNYNDYAEGSGWAPPLYNGNITQTIWKTANTDSDKRSYAYIYDDLNRIIAGKYRREDPVTHLLDQDVDRYSLFYMLYDRNGNLERLRRNGHTNNAATTFGRMDYLIYSYNGNQLEQVNDYDNNTYGYSEGSNAGAGIDYIYDANGNMVRDYSKNIGDSTLDVDGIWYNHLNLPITVRINNNVNEQISYIYDATGIKQKKVVTNGASNITTTEYAGNYIYEDGDLKFFSHPEGYTERGQLKAPIGGGASFYEYDYIYQYKDHLGNIRLSYEDSNNDGAVNTAEVIEENNYYPFGLKHKGYNNVINGTDHKYGFGGKEEQDELGLGWIDITARNYDPALGRWMNLDPLAEQMPEYSPYTYAFNNPIYFLDPDGEKPCPNGDCGGAVVAVFFHGGAFGGGKTTTAAQAGGTGNIYNKTQSYTESQGREFKGTIIAPGATSASGVNTALDYIKENFSAGDQLVIYGYSYGVDVAVELTEALNELGIEVDLLVTVDGSDGPLQNTTVNDEIPDNVDTNLNVYQDNDSGTSNASSGSSSGSSSGATSSASAGPSGGAVGSSSGSGSGSGSGTSSGSSGSSSPSSNSPGSNGGPNSAVGSANVVNRNVSGKGVTHGNIQQKAEKTINYYIQSYIRTYQDQQ